MAAHGSATAPGDTASPAPVPDAPSGRPDVGPAVPAGGRSPNGTPVELTAGRYRALLSPVGAALLGLWFDDRPLTLPADPAVIPDGYSGKVLMPWPNRIAGARYRFAGQEYQLPVNEPETGSALHGLVLWQEWAQDPAPATHAPSLDVGTGTDSAAGSAVVFRLRFAGEPGYPFPLDLEVGYRLHPETGLAVEMRAVNAGTGPAPYGVSIHPYLTAGGADLDRCRLTLPAAQVLDGGGLRPVDGPRFDYRESGPAARPLDGTRLDHAFTGLPAAAWQVRLQDPQEDFGVLLEADGAAGARWVQVYTGERLGRAGLAVEPMSCPADAFNSGTDLAVLAPGEEHRFHCRIAAA